MTATDKAAAHKKTLLAERSRNGTWLDSQRFPPLQWAVPGVIPEGYAMVAAPPKAGKSWFVASIGLAVAVGGFALGQIRVKQRPVLYFALEDGDRRLQNRFRKIMHQAPLPDAMHRVLEVKALLELVQIAEAFQDQHETPPLIIVDTLGKVSPGRSGSQQQYDADYALGSVLQNLAKRKPGCTVLAVHHTNKGVHDGDFLNSVSGTLGVVGACDAVLLLKRDRGSKHGFIQMTGRDMEREPEFAINNNGAGWELAGADLDEAEAVVSELKQQQADSRFSDNTKAILRVLRELPDDSALSPKEVAEKLGQEPKIVGNALGKLEKSGHVFKPMRGQYRACLPNER